jgi:hypothetical protein
MKRIGLILLDSEHRYVYENGELPRRPIWDKRLLREYLRGEIVSHEAYKDMPMSLKRVCTPGDNYTVAFKIREIAECDVIVAIIGEDRGLPGKEFRFTGYRLLVGGDSVEVWIRAQ